MKTSAFALLAVAFGVAAAECKSSDFADVDLGTPVGDSDFDCVVTTPATTMPGDKLWFTLTTGAMTANGSVTPSP